MYSDESLTTLATALGDHLLQRHWQLAVAESCTGGWLAKVLTDIAGSSHWFDRGFVTYSNEAKQDMLAVPTATLTVHGAVSEPTVRAMVEGALRASRADIAAAITGIAGPGGGSLDKPVGTVWFAWGRRAGAVISQQHHFTGDRMAVRYQAVLTALQGLVERT
jgi:nicotinamide-nucleotide amidase